ncbi:hypothetical protein Bb109J_c2585 [Bdellovibrio bacteriovorus]|uniref:hypothetical protein n=1 Tax=Bdellovibrio bacteriovorus TaxID=959 RepID=UPI00045C0DEC|nr:hypothetical protein [Bdellovibrio bacteriovorus]AHZ85272.1 hypothetical protein EP01_10025 [Bdellovibrio bacteriovorus]BEV69165.1 hypothetical protein Bb109J_c2585 [Bdellovibrio bacteriovorus]
MRFIALLLFMTTSVNAWADGKAYLDLEEDQILSVFNKPGMNWKNCSADPNCRPVGWPDRDAAVEVISKPRKLKVEDPYTGQMQDEEYVQIKYSYTRERDGITYTQQGTGWVDAAYVSRSKTKAVYGAADDKSEYCPPVQKSTTGGGAKEVQKSISGIQSAIANKGVKETAAALKGSVGACVINPKNPPAAYKGENPFDSYVLPHLKKQAVPKVAREDGKMMTQQDLITIDALSRTMYAEMARCYKHGLHYPMAVAKIAVNRANTESRHKEFIKGSHNSGKSDLAKVVTTPSQFNLWMKTHNGKKNGPLAHALCPPADKNKLFWSGAKPSKEEQDIWNNTLRIATEAVLFPKKFNARTSQLKQFHYTSGMDSFFGMKQVFPWIADRKVSKNACVQVWDAGVKL